MLGDGVWFGVADGPVGIPEDIQDRIFEPFFTTREVGLGTGQGLSVAHSVVVKGHGGRISFTSVPGQGSRFVVQLPVDADTAEPSAA